MENWQLPLHETKAIAWQERIDKILRRRGEMKAADLDNADLLRAVSGTGAAQCGSASRRTPGSLAESLVWETTHGVDETTGFNKLQTVYRKDMEPRARAVECLTSALENCLDLLGTIPHLSTNPALVEGRAALEAAKNWR